MGRNKTLPILLSAAPPSAFVLKISFACSRPYAVVWTYSAIPRTIWIGGFQTREKNIVLKIYLLLLRCFITGLVGISIPPD